MKTGIVFLGFFLLTASSAFSMGINRCDGTLTINDLLKIQWGQSKSSAEYSPDTPGVNFCTDLGTKRSMKLIPQTHTGGYVAGVTTISPYIGNYRTHITSFKIPAKGFPSYSHIFGGAAFDDVTFNRIGGTVWDDSTLKIQFTHGGCNFGNHLFASKPIPGGLKSDVWYRVETQILYLDAANIHVTAHLYDFPAGATEPRRLVTTTQSFAATKEQSCSFAFVLNSKYITGVMHKFEPTPASMNDLATLIDDFTALADLF